MPRNKIGQGKRRGLGAGVAELEPVQGNFCLPSRLAHPWGAHAGEPGRRGRCLFPPLPPCAVTAPVMWSHNSLLPGCSSHFFPSLLRPGRSRGAPCSWALHSPLGLPYIPSTPCKSSSNNPNLSAVFCWNAENYSDI